MATMHHPNPAVFGVELVDAAATAIGLSGTAIIDDFFLAPAVNFVVPTLAANSALRKVVDGGTTLFAAFLYDLGVGKILRLSTWGKWGQLGGSALGLARLASAVIPGYQISSVTPVDSEIGNLFNPSHPANQMAAALNSGAASNNPAIAASSTASTTYTPTQGIANAYAGGMY